MNNITNVKFLGFIFIFIIVFGSCQKDIIDDFEPIGERWTNLSIFYENLETTKKIAVEQAEESFVLAVNEDVFIKFPEKSFTNTSGIPLEGKMLIELDHISNNGLAIMNQLNSTTFDLSSDVLFSEIILNMNFFQNNQPILMNPGVKSSIFIDGKKEDLQQLWKFSILKNNGYCGWNPSVNYVFYEDNWNFENNGNLYEGTGIKNDIENQGWINFASYQSALYPDEEDYSDVTISVESESDEIEVYLAYKNKLSVRKMIAQSDNIFYLDKVLLEEDVSIIVLGVENDQLVFDKYHFVAQVNNNISLKPEKIDHVALINELKNI